MKDNIREKQLQIRRESLKKRMPLVVLILICFLIYNFVLPYEILKWASLVILIVYLGIGFHFRKKIRDLNNEAQYEIIEENEEKKEE